ncbi:NAD(P)H-dependent oxidoreductase [Martelella alba]|uniref:NAD(P)H-dependent oxidoreductase n=1 Tax=Martelella alba TaxID=2590451 RepID=A0A506U0N4_9HYPH|nr:NAD(P)H-dependent oxidoreductase [Martelella alba]TPW27902.1 NAD(P)H-dependent oxidoreductase [Martelella alba]
MRILLVYSHPLPESFNAAIAGELRNGLTEKGHDVDFLDLYAEGFDPRLSVAERRGYYDENYDLSGVAGIAARLRAADGMILVFPQWSFNMPAMMKGFFDRVFAPGVGFEHNRAGGLIRPALKNLKFVYAFTTTGSPWWVVNLYMGHPVKRLLKRGTRSYCPHFPKFRMVNMHGVDKSSLKQREAHLARVRSVAHSL